MYNHTVIIEKIVKQCVISKQRKIFFNPNKGTEKNITETLKIDEISHKFVSK